MALIKNTKKRGSLLRRCASVSISVLFVAVAFVFASAAGTNQKTFASPEEAVKVMLGAVKSKDAKELEAIFGPGSKDLVSYGDPVADSVGYERFISLYEEKNRLQEESAEEVMLYVGKEDWPFPIPIVKKDGLWRFDIKKGGEEILARRIGRNELSVIQVCLAYVDAQREYALKDRNGDEFLEYAQKFASEPGKKDGLYWKVKEGDEQSPLGPLVVQAQEEGHTVKKSRGRPIAYHGYYYRILKALGKEAPGGAYDYMVKGKMIGGFALVAYPAKYGASGIMTFIVNHRGKVYEKDLGQNTKKKAQEMKIFNPDSTWKKVEEKDTMAKG